MIKLWFAFSVLTDETDILEDGVSDRDLVSILIDGECLRAIGSVSSTFESENSSLSNYLRWKFIRFINMLFLTGEDFLTFKAS